MKTYNIILLYTILITPALFTMEKKQEQPFSNNEDELRSVVTDAKQKLQLAYQNNNNVGEIISGIATTLGTDDKLLQQRVIGALGLISETALVHSVNNSGKSTGIANKLVVDDTKKEAVDLQIRCKRKNLYVVSFKNDPSVAWYSYIPNNGKFGLCGRSKPESTEDVICMELSNDETMLVTVNGNTEQIITLWDVATYRSLGSIKQTNAPIYRMALDLDGKRLAFLCMEDMRTKRMDLQIWHLSKGKDCVCLDKQHAISDITECEKFRDYYAESITFKGNKLHVTAQHKNISLVYSLSCARTIEQALLMYFASLCTAFYVKGYNDTGLTNIYRELTSDQKKLIQNICARNAQQKKRLNQMHWTS